MRKRKVKLLVGLLCMCLVMGNVGISAWANTQTNVLNEGVNDTEPENWDHIEYDGYLTGQNDREMLPQEDKWIPNTTGVCLWNDDEKEEGIYRELQVTSAEIVQQYTWGEDGREETDQEIFTLEESSDEGWNLHSNDYGSVDIKVVFKNQEDADIKIHKEYTFDINAISQIYDMNWVFVRDKNMMLTNSESEVGLSIAKHYHDDESNENRYGIEITDYTLSIIEKDEEENEITTMDLFIPSVNKENRSIALKSNQKEGWGKVWVRVEGTDENGDKFDSQWYFDMGVWSEYYDIQPSSIKNPQVGEELDIAGLVEDEALKVYYYNDANKNGTEVSQVEEENIQLYLSSYDKDVWESGEEDSIPTLTRKEIWRTEIDIVAAYGDGTEENPWVTC